MALKDIINHIKDDAAAEIAALKKRTDEEVHRIITECDEECDDIQDLSRKEGEQKAEELKRSFKIQARLDAQKELLEGRMQLIEQVFQSVRERLYGDEKMYRRFLIQEMAAAAVHGNEKIVMGMADHERFGPELVKIIEEVNKNLFSDNRKGELILTEEKGDFEGGFILRRGRARTIMTLDTVIAGLRDRFEPKVARILAGEDA